MGIHHVYYYRHLVTVPQIYNTKGASHNGGGPPLFGPSNPLSNKYASQTTHHTTANRSQHVQSAKNLPSLADFSVDHHSSPGEKSTPLSPSLICRIYSATRFESRRRGLFSLPQAICCSAISNHLCVMHAKQTHTNMPQSSKIGGHLSQPLLVQSPHHKP